MLLATATAAARADGPAAAAEARPHASPNASAASGAAASPAVAAKQDDRANARSVAAASGGSSVSGASVPRATNAQPLDLSPPPIRYVMTREQIASLLVEPDPDADPPEDVTVRSTHYEAPVPRGQLRAIPWALTHPLQAWRIFTPITDEDE